MTKAPRRSRGFKPLSEMTSDEAVVLETAGSVQDVKSSAMEMLFDRGPATAFDTASALVAQLQSPRFSWLTDINVRALQGRPCLKPGFKTGAISVHDPEYARLSLANPYYGFVATAVEGEDILLYSANDDNVARVYFHYGPDSYETLSLRIWHRLCRGSACVFDVGAFTGIYSLVARSVNRSCKCVAFEPMPHIRHRANMNVVLNGFTGTIEVEPYALSDATRMVPFYTSLGPTIMDSGGSVIPRGDGRDVSTELVQCITLDQYLAVRDPVMPNLIKINAGFHEAAVLRGAHLLLETARPSLLIEVAKSKNLSEIASVLRAANYRVFSIHERQQYLYEHDGDLPLGRSSYDALDEVHNVIACHDPVATGIVLDAAARNIRQS